MVHDFKWLTLVLLLTSVQAAKAVEVSDADLILQHITASINYLWSTTITDEVWICEEPCNGTWEPVDGSLKQLDASDTEVWGIDSGDAVYKAPIDGSANWTTVPGRLVWSTYLLQVMATSGLLALKVLYTSAKSHARESGRQ